MDVYIEIIGLDKFDSMEKKKIDSEVTEMVKKYGKLVDATSFTLHIDKYHKEGSRSKISLRARMNTPKKLFAVKGWGWSILEAIQELKNSLQSVIETYVDKKKEHKSI